MVAFTKFLLITMSEVVIELSIEETNKLRGELGLKPLRGVNSSSGGRQSETLTEESSSSISAPNSNGTSSHPREQLELSVDETNKLRASLGLKPLNTKKDAIHAPAENEGAQKELDERLEKEKLRRQVQRGITATFGSATLGESKDDSAVSWAQKMLSADTNKARATTTAQQETTEKSNARLKKQLKKNKKLKSKGVIPKYDEEDLEGINVGHAVSDFEAGSTTILTLADAPLLQTAEGSKKLIGLNDIEDSVRLENSQLADQQIQKDRLRQKRQVEMGLGRAGGYAGYDDDEFEELGGVQAPTRLARGALPNAITGDETSTKRRGFQLGGALAHDKAGAEPVSDLFAHEAGKAISLEHSSINIAASDFMTAEEYAAQNPKRKKEMKFKKKKSKKEKKNKRVTDAEDDEEDEERQAPKGSILDELERTAIASVNKRKRRRDGDDDDDPDSNRSMGDSDDTHKRRARFDEIMEKGNEQTAKAFKPLVKETVLTSTLDDEEPDDNFLNEALAKARRLRKLRELSGPKGAEAVAQAVLDSQVNPEELNQSTSMSDVTFTVDETREFSRALLARENQEERQKAKKQLKTAQIVDKSQTNRPKEATRMEDGAQEGEPEDMAELAKQIKEDDEDHIGIGLDGTAAVAPVGRGMAGVLSMLRHTGEISGRNAGREELRGRAKDERTYEDYAPLDLKAVVRIGRGATEKDRELASREIKLDYRDEHGRLLTRKEAYRNLCYQFHGHGSSAKNEERRLRQIEREQAEARIASRQATGAGSLGALRATQKATGKAFIVHKT